MSRWIFDVEIVARYLEGPDEPGGPPRRARIYEVAVQSWHHHAGSKLRPHDLLRAAVDLGGIWRRRGKPR